MAFKVPRRPDACRNIWQAYGGRVFRRAYADALSPCLWRGESSPPPSRQRQTTLKDRIERKKNVSDIIAVKDKHLTANRICVVVDDVITTGATMCACMGALKKSGARAVYGIAVAHGEKMW